MNYSYCEIDKRQQFLLFVYNYLKITILPRLIPGSLIFARLLATEKGVGLYTGRLVYTMVKF